MTGPGGARLPLLIALPPSEGKAPGGDGPPLDVLALSRAAALTGARERVLDALSALCTDAEAGRRHTRARTVLGLSAGLADEVAVDAALRTAPTLRAAERYTGVLYDHLGLGTLPAAARRRAAERVVILSGLWGVVGPEDRIPPYRLAMGVTLPRAGRLAAHWQAPLAAALPQAALVVDCRSAAYAAAWRPPAGCTVLAVRVFSLAPGGARTVVSHMAKATRGEVARALLLRAGRRTDAATPQEVAAVAEAAGLRCELLEPERAGRSWTLDVLAPGRSG